jgi:hypothetical protein
MVFLRRWRKVGAASAEGHRQAVLDDPDFLDVSIDE